MDVNVVVCRHHKQLVLCITNCEISCVVLWVLKELEKKVSQTAPFQNLKQMLQKKNDQIKDLRRRLSKYVHKRLSSSIICYIHHRLASREGIVTVGVTLSHCVCVCPPSRNYAASVSVAKVMCCIQCSLVVWCWWLKVTCRDDWALRRYELSYWTALVKKLKNSFERCGQKRIKI